MARRASQSSTNPKQLITIIAVIAAIILAVFVFMPKQGTSQASKAATLPVDDYLERGSILRDNQYQVSGVIEERIPCGNGELITVAVKNGVPDRRVCIIVPSDAKKVNLEREQEYLFIVTVKDYDENHKGLLVAKEILTMR